MGTTTHLAVNLIDVGHLRRPVSDSKVADLMDSVLRLGLLQPPVVTTAHKLVAGRHRLEAVRRLGWATVLVVVELSDLEARLATLDENLIRNDLTRLDSFERLVERAEIVAALGLRQKAGRPARNPDTVSGLPLTTDDIAAASGLSGSTLQRAVKIVASIPEHVRLTLKATPLADSTTGLLRLSRPPPDDQEAVADRAAAGERGAVNDLALAVKRGRRAEDAALQTARQPADDEHVFVGRFEDVGHVVPDDGAAMFLCDPPYADTAMYGDLGRLAARKPRPGGWLVTYHSVLLLPHVVQELGQSLVYYSTLAIGCSGVHKQFNNFRVRSGWKPLLVYYKPPRTMPPDWLDDFRFGAGNEKGHHRWEQPVEEARYVIERLTDPGDLVVDATCSSGTSLVAAKLAGRRWIGIDVDAAAASIARSRLRDAVPTRGAHRTPEAHDDNGHAKPQTGRGRSG